MGDQKNLILAMLLSILILVGWDYVFVKPQVEEQQRSAAVVEQEGVIPTSPQTAGPDSPSPRVLPREQVINDAPRVAIETPNLRGSISLKGARIDDLLLTRYHETVSKTSPNITLFSPSGAEHPYYAEFGWAAAGGLDLPTRDTVWTADRDTLAPGQPVTLSWDNGSGLTFRLRFEVDEDFMFSVTQSVENQAGGPVALNGYGRIARTNLPEGQSFFVLHEGPLGVFNGTLEEADYDDLVDDGPQQFQTTGGWLGITDKYWLAAMVPDQELPFTGAFRSFGPDAFQADFLTGAVNVASGSTQSQTIRLFAGAKEVALIDKYEEQYGIPLFDRAIDWGWFYFLTRPIFAVLSWLYQLVGNFGVAIIGLTVLMKAIMFPLANKSYASMNRLRELQPKMKELQERYKDDKAAQQKAIMEMYQKEKVNPLGGCLPILLQIPVFFALYKVLFVTIEMRHQPFILWIKDLSAPDPLTPVNLFGLLPFTPPQMIAIGILPIIMGLTMWLQQKLNPQPVDPVQQKVFGLMPIIFTFILAPFAAGLVLYWTVNNVLSILQQWMLMKRHDKERAAEQAAKAAAKAEKRKHKA
ncbi:MAG TPA: membrane protein insertase YidC [Pedomonas sp.]|nr:membrane protein insertase YidC [Pedomonas sp.]